MQSVILTDKIIQKLESDERSEFHLWDCELPGFGVRVRRSGHKTYVLFYRPKNRRRVRKLSLGLATAIPAKEARRHARELLGKIAAGEDPADKRLAYRNSSLRSAYEVYIDNHLRNVSLAYATQNQRIFKTHFLPKLGDKALGEISRVEIREITDRIAKKYKVAGSNAHRVFSAFLSWCVDRGLIENQILRGARPPTPYRSRERTLSETELVAVWKACDRLPKLWRTYFRALILTGQRRTEVARMHWSEINLKEKIWTLPGARTKNRREHTVPLSPSMLEVLRDAPGQSEFVFPCPYDRHQPVYAFCSATKELRQAADVLGFRLHDLRRTAATLMGKIGVAPHVIDAVLNHKSGAISGIAAIYNRYGYEREKRAGLERYGEHLAELVSPTNDESNIEKFQPTRFPRVAHG